MEIKTTREIYTNCVHEDSWKKYEGAILCMDWDKRWVAVDDVKQGLSGLWFAIEEKDWNKIRKSLLEIETRLNNKLKETDGDQKEKHKNNE